MFRRWFIGDDAEENLHLVIVCFDNRVIDGNFLRFPIGQTDIDKILDE